MKAQSPPAVKETELTEMILVRGTRRPAEPQDQHRQLCRRFLCMKSALHLMVRSTARVAGLLCLLQSIKSLQHRHIDKVLHQSSVDSTDYQNQIMSK